MCLTKSAIDNRGWHELKMFFFSYLYLAYFWFLHFLHVTTLGPCFLVRQKLFWYLFLLTWRHTHAILAGVTIFLDTKLWKFRFVFEEKIKIFLCLKCDHFSSKFNLIIKSDLLSFWLIVNWTQFIKLDSRGWCNWENELAFSIFSLIQLRVCPLLFFQNTSVWQPGRRSWQAGTDTPAHTHSPKSIACVSIGKVFGVVNSFLRAHILNLSIFSCFSARLRPTI